MRGRSNHSSEMDQGHPIYVFILIGLLFVLISITTSVALIGAYLDWKDRGIVMPTGVSMEKRSPK